MTDVIVPGHTALVTGAASGIGRAVCLALARRGMNVGLVDLPGDRLDAALAEVAAAGPGDAAKFAADVGDPAQIAALRRDALARFGRIHLLMNNAVTRIGRGHDAAIADWRQAFEVNFWGVVEAVRAFLPGMQEAGAPAMVVNTGSKQGITNPPGHPVYNIAKAALKTYTEALEHELRSASDNAGPGNRVSAHLLIPGWTTTGDAEHKPGAWLPGQVADFMIAALERGDFYILCPDGETTTEMDRKRILWGAGDITENRPPLSRWHPEFAALAKQACEQ